MHVNWTYFFQASDDTNDAEIKEMNDTYANRAVQIQEIISSVSKHIKLLKLVCLPSSANQFP